MVLKNPLQSNKKPFYLSSEEEILSLRLNPVLVRLLPSQSAHFK
jgi:hypothetical protein